MADSLGERLALARTNAGLTQRQLAKRVGRHRSTIANIERGMSDTTVPQLVALAAELGVTVGWLAAGEEAPAPAGLLSALRGIRAEWQTTATTNRLAGWPEIAERVAMPARIIAQLDEALAEHRTAQTDAAIAARQADTTGGSP
ncbi:hypothetical protein GCM10027258_62940 [Amycolatopsis stemonae]